MSISTPTLLQGTDHKVHLQHESSAFQASYFNRIVKLWNFICKSVPKSSLSCIDVFKTF